MHSILLHIKRYALMCVGWAMFLGGGNTLKIAAADLSACFAQACLHDDTYIRSLPYYLLTGRKGAFYCRHGDSHLIVCEHPHVSERLLVFPEISGDGTLTASFLRQIDFPRNGIQLAKYTKQDLKKLLNALERASFLPDISISDIDEEIMDWKYPVHILDTQTVALMAGKKFEKLRNKFNKASANLTIIPLASPEANTAMRASLMFWLGGMIYAGKETGHSLSEYYETLFRLYEASPEMFDGFVCMYGKEPAGFTIWDNPPVKGSVNAIASLNRISIKGMAEFQIVNACRTLVEKSVKFYNLGGSETSTLDSHKKKYLPVKSINEKSYEISMKTQPWHQIECFQLA